MKTQPTTRRRKSLRFRFFFLLILATISPASLVCAQTATSTHRDKHHVTAKKVESGRARDSVIVAREKQRQTNQQRNEPADARKLITSNDTLTVGGGTPIKHIISVTKSIVFSNSNSSMVEVSVPGATPTDLVMIGVADNTFEPLSVSVRGVVESADKVLIRLKRVGLPGPNFPLSPIMCRIVVIGF
jgi:hypothetical protein